VQAKVLHQPVYGGGEFRCPLSRRFGKCTQLMVEREVEVADALERCIEIGSARIGSHPDAPGAGRVGVSGIGGIISSMRDPVMPVMSRAPR
jgi:hypothetical protein